MDLIIFLIVACAIIFSIALYLGSRFSAPRIAMGRAGDPDGPGQFETLVRDLTSASHSILLACRECSLPRFSPEQRNRFVEILLAKVNDGVTVTIAHESEAIHDDLKALQQSPLINFVPKEKDALCWYGRLIDDVSLTLYFGKRDLEIVLQSKDSTAFEDLRKLLAVFETNKDAAASAATPATTRSDVRSGDEIQLTAPPETPFLRTNLAKGVGPSYRRSILKPTETAELGERTT